MAQSGSILGNYVLRKEDPGLLVGTNQYTDDMTYPNMAHVVFVRSTVVQLGTPEAMRGRISAVHMLFVGAANELGEFRAGVAAAWLGAVPAVLLGGACTLAVVGVWALLFHELRRVDRLADVKITP